MLHIVNACILAHNAEVENVKVNLLKQGLHTKATKALDGLAIKDIMIFTDEVIIRYASGDNVKMTLEIDDEPDWVL